MNWPQFLGLMLQFGPRAFDLAEKIVSKWTSPEPLTLEDIAAARKLGERTGRDAMLEALIRAGVPLDSPKAVELLALVP